MVKADVKNDYYADLDLTPTADAEEIKKQFRTLGDYLL
jgi:curved DNA-binding protein CbpA